MIRSHLLEVFEHLSQHSMHSVQTGRALNDLDEYLHVERPVERRLMEKMDEIDQVGGGIILLVGSAGDGKSHLISKVREQYDWSDSCFYNDATASSSPNKTAIDTLKEALRDFEDSSIMTTTRKLVLAINLGKLNAFIEDEYVIEHYNEIVKGVTPVFKGDDTASPIENERIKYILFTEEQMFEFNVNEPSEYPVRTPFLSSLLDKITAPVVCNPFYKAYKEDVDDGISPKDPLVINYELLSIPEIRTTICMTVIEAIVRYKLNITPREFLDFIYAIMVFPHYHDYEEKRDFFDSLLPNLLYSGGKNIIKKAVANLDPLKYSSTDHDKQLSVLFTSHEIPQNYLPISVLGLLPTSLLNRTNEFYCNNGRDIENTTKFVFRLKHILSYHSESVVYKSFLSILKGVFKKDIHAMQDVYNVVSKAIPRHYGSYYGKSNMIPLNIQGGRYRLFAGLSLKPEPINANFNNANPSKFFMKFDLSWRFPDGNVKLTLDYPLYCYLFELNKGKLALSYENEKDLAFSRFVRQLMGKCNCEQSLTVVKSDATEMELYESSFGNIQLS